MRLDRNGKDRDLLTRRRALVSRLRLRGMTVLEITDGLAKERIINPQTGKPFTYQTVQNDLEALRAEWRENAAQDIDEHRSRQLAEIAEIKRLAWTEKDGNLALSALDKEMKLLGTLAVTRIAIEGNLDITLINATIKALTDIGKDPAEVFNKLIAAAVNADNG